MDIKKTLEKAVQTLSSERLNLANGVIAVGSPEAGAVLGAISFIKKLKRWIIVGLVSVATAVIAMITVVNNHANLIMEQYTNLNNRTSDSKQSYEKPVKFVTKSKDGVTKVEVVYSNTVKDQFLGSYGEFDMSSIGSSSSTVVRGDGSNYIDVSSDIQSLTKEQFLEAVKNNKYDSKSLEIAYDVLHELFDGDMNAIIGMIGNFMNEGDVGLVQGGMSLYNWNNDGKTIRTVHTPKEDRTYVESRWHIQWLRNHLASVDKNHIGIGIAQWTYKSRLTGLLDTYDKCIEGIADNTDEFHKALEKAEYEFMLKEMRGYSSDMKKYAYGQITTNVNGVDRTLDSWWTGVEPGSIEAWAITGTNVYEKPADRAGAVTARVNHARDILKQVQDYMENR